MRVLGIDPGLRILGWGVIEAEAEYYRHSNANVHRGMHTLAAEATDLYEACRGRVARFLDLDEELAGSGLGRGSLAVIGQGEVSGVLMADPARLLSLSAGMILPMAFAAPVVVGWGVLAGGWCARGGALRRRWW